MQTFVGGNKKWQIRFQWWEKIWLFVFWFEWFPHINTNWKMIDINHVEFVQQNQLHSFYVFEVWIYLTQICLFVQCSSKDFIFARIEIEYSVKVKKENSWHFNASSKVKIIQYFWDCSLFSFSSCFVGFIFLILHELKKNGLHLGCKN